VTSKKFKIKDFKRDNHLEKDGEALYLAIQKGHIPSDAEGIVRGVGITEGMGMPDIVKRLRKAMAEEDGVVAELARKEAEKEKKTMEGEDYKDTYKSLIIPEDELPELIEDMAEVHYKSVVNGYRKLIIKTLDAFAV
jgi:hypothetical protein